MLFGTASSIKKASNFSVSFDDVDLKPAQSIKMLGVLLDQELNMQRQVSNVTKRCYGALLTISKLRDTLPRKTIVHLIQSLVFSHSHVTYCLPAWAPPTQQQRHRIDKIVYFATRIVTRKRRNEHILVARQELGWIPFSALIDLRDSVLIHSIVHQDQGPQRLKALLSYRSDVSERTTRSTSAGLLETHRCRLEATKMTVPYRAVRKWKLDKHIRDNDSAKSFRKRVQAMLIN